MSIVINGTSYSGNNISIVNGRVTIDGKEHTPTDKVINIVVNGNIDSLHVDVCKLVEVHGEVNDLTTTSGDVVCGNVKNDVSTTSGDIECGNIGGSVKSTSGDVTAETIAGKVTTVSGDISSN